MRGNTIDKLSVPQARAPSNRSVLVVKEKEKAKLPAIKKNSLLLPELAEETELNHDGLMARKQSDNDQVTNYPSNFGTDAKQGPHVEKEQLPTAHPNLAKLKEDKNSGSQSLVVSKRIDVKKISKDKGLKDDQTKIFKGDSTDESGFKGRKFRRNNNSKKKKLTASSLVVVLAVLIAFTLSMIPVPVMTTSIRKSLELLDTLVSFSTDVRMAYFTFLESLATRQQVIIDGQPFFPRLAVKVSGSHNQINQNIDSIPTDFADFQSYTKKALQGNVCTELLEPKHSITSKSMLIRRL